MRLLKNALAVVAALLFTSANAQTWLTNGLTAYYPFDGNANDSSGNGNHGIVNGFFLTQDQFGKSNSAYTATSATSFITTTIQQSPPNTFTVSIWFKTTNSGNCIGYFNSQNGANNSLGNFDRALGVDDGTGQLFGYVFTGSVQYVFSSKRYDDNLWHQAILTVSPAGMILYADGKPVSTNSAATSGQQDSSWWRIGRDYIGSLDNVRIYNRALSSVEVSQLFRIESGFIVDLQKAVYLTSSNLQIGTNYQIQVTTDLKNWTNSGSVFTATNSSWRTTNYWDVANWNQLFFRLQQQ